MPQDQISSDDVQKVNENADPTTQNINVTDGVKTEASQKLYPVIKVVDGDTITVQQEGANETVRAIGINSPETVSPSQPVECFGKEASNKAKELLTDKQVSLESDDTQSVRDKYNRSLAYIRTQAGLFFNLEMIKQGYAYEYTYSTPYKYQKEFQEAQRYAQDKKLGLWADEACAGTNNNTNSNKNISPVVPTPPPTPAPTPSQNTNAQPTAQKYDCSSNKYNCTDFKTQAEAQGVFEFCGGSSNDVHRLDGNDKDGKVCETLL